MKGQGLKRSFTRFSMKGACLLNIVVSLSLIKHQAALTSVYAYSGSQLISFNSLHILTWSYFASFLRRIVLELNLIQFILRT